MTAIALPDELVRIAFRFFEGLGTPKSLAAAVMLRYEDWEGLARLSVRPSDYIDAEDYCRDNAAICFLKKLQELPVVTDRRVSALATWWDGEHQCYRSNERLNRYKYLHRNCDDRVNGVASFLGSVRKIINGWIGNSPPDLLKGRFGPGVTYSDKGVQATVPHKMSSDPTSTSDAVWFLPQMLGTQWGAALARRQGKIQFVPGNRLATVPKTALIDRCIAAEPSINGFFQLALGRVLRQRLKQNAGWDLDTAQETHRRVACESSVTCDFCTVDLSNASDTVCRNLVEILLPPFWFDQLNDLRSHATCVDGSWVRLEKFSSMGNGFTFELETIIFAGLACATVRENGGLGQLGVDVFVFGDDIIVPDKNYTQLKAVLEFCGFKLNVDKSFFGGVPFRESCGGDFFAGKPVRGYYCKDIPRSPTEYITLANGLHALAERLSACGFSAPSSAWFSVLDQIPERIRRCRGPKDLGDIVIWDRPETHVFKWRNGIRYYRAIIPDRLRVVLFSEFSPDVVLACATYGTGSTSEGVIPRNAVLSYKLAWVPFS